MPTQRDAWLDLPAPPGTYRYRLTVREGSGAVVLTREAFLVGV